MVKYRIIWFIQDIKRLYYKIFHNVSIGDGLSILPKIGKGKFVSVLKRGKYYDVVPTNKNEYVRFIPYQPNHGFMIEYWENNKLRIRQHFDYDSIKNYLKGSQEDE